MSAPSYEPREEDRVAWLERCAAQSVPEFVAECRAANDREALARVIEAWPVEERPEDDYWAEKRRLKEQGEEAA